MKNNLFAFIEIIFLYDHFLFCEYFFKKKSVSGHQDSSASWGVWHQPDDLSSDPRTHMVVEDNSSSRLFGHALCRFTYLYMQLNKGSIFKKLMFHKRAWKEENRIAKSIYDLEMEF